MITDLGKSIGNTLQNLFGAKVTDEAIDGTIKDICMTLIKYNVSPVLVGKLRNDVKNKIAERLDKANKSNSYRAKLVQMIVQEEMVKLVNPDVPAYKIMRGKTNVVVFVGLQGCGKTTSICKYANYYKKKNFRVGIVCADTFRAGAYEQVKQNATKIGVPFFGSPNPDPVAVAREGVAKFRKSDFELILVDTSGRHTQEDALFSEMRGLVDAVNPDNIVFVMDAGIGQSAQEQAEGFKRAVPVGGIILTKLDGAERAGGALSSIAVAGCPIEFVGMGEGMEDLEVFEPSKFISKLLNSDGLHAFLQKLSTIEVNEAELTEKMVGGKFKLIDFKNIYSQILSLGPVSQMLEMFMGSKLKGIKMPSEQKFQRITYIFDSMCKKELNSNGDLILKEPSRLARIAMGSGTTENEVTETILNFRQMNSVMKNMMNNPMFSQMLGGLNTDIMELD